jgi:hypothetical protein
VVWTDDGIGASVAGAGTGARCTVSSISDGNAPLDGTAGVRENKLVDAGIDAVAVAEETVVDDCDAPDAPIVLEDTVLGEGINEAGPPT